MTAPLLAVEGLRVEYEDVTAVDDVSFDVMPGMVYGLIGPNGAGKTSIMNSVATLTEPTWGTIRINGIDILQDPPAALAHLGFMPDHPPLYEDLSVTEFMEMFASAYALPRESRTKTIMERLGDVDLLGKKDTPTGQLSRGMKQRLFLAKTLLHDPLVLILDEPASGLDPHARKELGAVIRRMGEQGRGVLVSSHILAEMADFCNSVGIIERGIMKVSGRIEDILADLRPGREMLASLLAPDDRLGSFLAAREEVRDVLVDGAAFRFTLDGEAEAAAALLTDLINGGFAVCEFHNHEGDLQDVFHQVSQGAVQ